ncbi:MAG: DUF2332 domain-containing protein [Pseudomonadota bacterium]
MIIGLSQNRRDDLIDAFRKQAAFCRKRGAAFTAAVVDAAGDELTAENKSFWTLISDFEGDPHKGALALRIAGALHALVLKKRGGALERIYAKPDVVPDAPDLRNAMAPLFENESGVFKAYVAGAPQTNEINRASVLLFGFSAIAKKTGLALDLYEAGASAGLLLCWDRFRYDFGDFQWGAGETTIRSELNGGFKPALHEDINVASRCGCDLNPLDLSDPETVLRMTSFIWPEERGRHALFDQARGQVTAVNPHLEKADALSWIEARLNDRSPDQASVFYHSVFAPYLSDTDIAALSDLMDTAGRSATVAAPVAYLRFEPEDIDGTFEFFLDLKTWPGGENRRLLRAHPHGLWVEPLSDF